MLAPTVREARSMRRDGKAQAWSLRFSRSGPAIPLEPGLTLVEARSFEPVRQRLVIDCAARGETLFQVVGGHRLDSTGLARLARAHGLDPAYVLRSSSVARAFTAYQLTVLLRETLPAETHHALSVVLDPLSLYSDEDVRRSEGLVLARDSMAVLREAAADRPVLVVQPPQRRRALARVLHEAAHDHIRVHPVAHGAVVELVTRGQRVHVGDGSPGQTTLARFGVERQVLGPDGDHVVGLEGSRPVAVEAVPLG